MNRSEFHALESSNLSHLARSLYLFYLRPLATQRKIIVDLNELTAKLTNNSDAFPFNAELHQVAALIEELYRHELIAPIFGFQQDDYTFYGVSGRPQPNPNENYQDKSFPIDDTSLKNPAIANRLIIRWNLIEIKLPLFAEFVPAERPRLFRMYDSWEPGATFRDLALMAGLIDYSYSEQELVAFINYWTSQYMERNQQGWERTFIKRLIKLRFASASQERRLSSFPNTPNYNYSHQGSIYSNQANFNGTSTQNFGSNANVSFNTGTPLSQNAPYKNGANEGSLNSASYGGSHGASSSSDFVNNRVTGMPNQAGANANPYEYRNAYGTKVFVESARSRSSETWANANSYGYWEEQEFLRQNPQARFNQASQQSTGNIYDDTKIQGLTQSYAANTDPKALEAFLHPQEHLAEEEAKEKTEQEQSQSEKEQRQAEAKAAFIQKYGAIPDENMLTSESAKEAWAKFDFENWFQGQKDIHEHHKRIFSGHMSELKQAVEIAAAKDGVLHYDPPPEYTGNPYFKEARDLAIKEAKKLAHMLYLERIERERNGNLMDSHSGLKNNAHEEIQSNNAAPNFNTHGNTNFQHQESIYANAHAYDEQYSNQEKYEPQGRRPKTPRRPSYTELYGGAPDNIHEADSVWEKYEDADGTTQYRTYEAAPSADDALRSYWKKEETKEVFPQAEDDLDAHSVGEEISKIFRDEN